MEDKASRVDRLLKALDAADGKEDFIIHRAHALHFLQTELQRVKTGHAKAQGLLSQEELIMSLRSLRSAPATFRRKTPEEILALFSQAPAAPPSALL